MSTLAFRWRLAAALIMLALPACDDSTAPPPSISVELSSSALGVTQGRTASVAVWVFSEDYDGSVELAVAGAPAGVAVQFEPGLIQTGHHDSKLTVTVSPSAAPGTYSLTITGSGSGVSSVPAMLLLTIAEAPPPDLALYAGAQSLSVGRGQDNWVPVTVARDDYEGAVELALQGVPVGVMATLDHTVLPPGMSVTLLRIHASAGAAMEKHALTITASGIGVPAKAATLDLTVTDPLPTVTHVEMVLEAICAVPVWFDPAVIVTRLSGFNGPIELSVEGLPPGVSGRLDVAEIGGSVSGWLLLNTDLADVDGSAYAMIRARSPGAADATAVFKVCGGHVW